MNIYVTPERLLKFAINNCRKLNRTKMIVADNFSHGYGDSIYVTIDKGDIVLMVYTGTKKHPKYLISRRFNQDESAVTGYKLFIEEFIQRSNNKVSPQLQELRAYEDMMFAKQDMVNEACCRFLNTMLDDSSVDAEEFSNCEVASKVISKTISLLRNLGATVTY